MIIIVMHNLADIVIKSCGKQGKADEHTRNLLKSSLSSYTTENPRDAVSSNCGDGDSHDDHDDDDDDHGLPAYSHHDKIPLWWENVNNDKGGNVSNMNIIIIFSLIHTMPGAMYAGATPARLVGREMAR